MYSNAGVTNTRGNSAGVKVDEEENRADNSKTGAQTQTPDALGKGTPDKGKLPNKKAPEQIIHACQHTPCSPYLALHTRILETKSQERGKATLMQDGTKGYPKGPQGEKDCSRRY